MKIINPKDINKYLPIGTVVFTKKDIRMFMIVGLKVKKGNEEFDYALVSYPEGYINWESLFLFNHSDITDILYLGSMNKKHKEYSDFLNEKIDKYKIV